MKGTTPIEGDLYEVTKDRIRRLYDITDYVSVMFSGGKDSTVVLNATIEVARELDRLPLEVVFFDEEAIPPQTAEYVSRVADRPDVLLYWYCHPVKHRNGCSRREPHWYPWNPDKSELWVRDQPDVQITMLSDKANRLTMRECTNFTNGVGRGICGQLFGIRAQESLRRRRSVSQRVKDNYIFNCSDLPNIVRGYPIYDWQTDDVWTAASQFGWDYNEAYDVMAMAGVTPFLQRVGPPFGEEPLQRLWTYAVCWPELWEKMIARVDGAAAAGRHARTPLYGNGGVLAYDEPMEAIERALKRWPDEIASGIREQILQLVNYHFSKTTEPLPKMAPSGVLSWRFLLMKAKRGDLKKRRAVVHSDVEPDWMKDAP